MIYTISMHNGHAVQEKKHVLAYMNILLACTPDMQYTLGYLLDRWCGSAYYQTENTISGNWETKPCTEPYLGFLAAGWRQVQIHNSTSIPYPANSMPHDIDAFQPRHMINYNRLIPSTCDEQSHTSGLLMCHKAHQVGLVCGWIWYIFSHSHNHVYTNNNTSRACWHVRTTQAR
jgi:hypothetical protein